MEVNMPDAILPHVRLEAVYVAVPEREIRIEDELEHYGGSQKKDERGPDLSPPS